MAIIPFTKLVNIVSATACALYSLYSLRLYTSVNSICRSVNSTTALRNLIKKMKVAHLLHFFTVAIDRVRVVARTKPRELYVWVMNYESLNNVLNNVSNPFHRSRSMQGILAIEL